jgi:hypothetical protein
MSNMNNIFAALNPSEGDQEPGTVCHRAVAFHAHGHARWSVLLCWRAANPYTVEFWFLNVAGAGQDVVWLVGRELLAEALRTERATGDGDVHFIPSHDDELVMALHGHNGDTDVEFFIDDLRWFLTATENVIPIGEELLWVSIDDAITTLLARGTSWPGSGEVAA